MLESLGWNNTLAAAFCPHEREGHTPARVCAEHKNSYRILLPDRSDNFVELMAEVSGRVRHGETFPAVGDWVAVNARFEEARAIIHGILPRHGHFTRKACGVATRPQIVAANVDVVFLLQGLDGDFNPRRLERYLLMAWEGGANATVVLNKLDTCHDVAARLQEVRAVAGDVPIHCISALHGDGIDALDAYLAPGRTVAILGSSGAGKSTLVNRLLGERRLRTRSVRASDDRGRHTTTHRQLVRLPNGALVLDTPGMRELQLLGEGSDGPLAEVFQDVSAIVALCRFRDCTHVSEPGCAVQAAIVEGCLAPQRLAAWRKLQRELLHVAMKSDERLRQAEQRRWKSITRQMRQRPYR